MKLICPIFFKFQDEKDFRDKLSSIYVALNFSLDPEAAADSRGLRPILNYQAANVIEQKVFWCGPELRVSQGVLCEWGGDFRVGRSQALGPSA